MVTSALGVKLGYKQLLSEKRPPLYYSSFIDHHRWMFSKRLVQINAFLEVNDQIIRYDPHKVMEVSPSSVTLNSRNVKYSGIGIRRSLRRDQNIE